MTFPFLTLPPFAAGCGDPGTVIPYGCAFDGAQRLTRSVGSGCNSRVFGLSLSVRRVKLGAVQTLWSAGRSGTAAAIGETAVRFTAADQLQVVWGGANGGTLTSVAVWRDPTSHYDITVAFNLAGPAPVVQAWVNGEPVVMTASGPQVVLDSAAGLAGQIQCIGHQDYNDSGWLSAVLSRIIYLDGIAPTPDLFGRRNRVGVWVARRYTGAYGQGGWSLDFADADNLGSDRSGNGNHWTPAGLTASARVTDTPTTPALCWSSVLSTAIPPMLLTDGGVTAVQSVTGGYYSVGASVPVPATGRWFMRGRWIGLGPYTTNNAVGLIPVDRGLFSAATALTQQTDVVGYGGTGYVVCGSAVPQFSVPVLTADDYWLIAVDSDAASIWLGYERAGAVTWWDAAGGTTGNPEAGINPTYRDPAHRRWVLATSLYAFGCGNRLEAGGKIPSGYRWISGAATPCPVIGNPADFMMVRALSAGGGVSDLPWNPLEAKTLVLSKRLDGTSDWAVTDSLRGSGRVWAPNTTAAEANEAGAGLTFTPSGYGVGTALAYQGQRLDLVWRASPAAGFDIVAVSHTAGTASTVPHAVGGIIDYAWVVPTATGGTRRVYHRALGGDRYQTLGTGDVGTDSGWLTSTSATLTLAAGLPSGVYHVYAWRSVPQFSAFGSYTGTGNANGPVLPMDFTPRLLLSKGPDASHESVVTRLGQHNPERRSLMMDRPDGEVTSDPMAVDAVSSGVKIRGTAGNRNTDGALYTYAAWAAVPGKFSRAR